MCPQPTIVQSKKAINIYLCYAYDVYKDKALIDEIDKHLSSLERQGQIMIWSVRKVSAGKELVREIDNYLNSADIILLLISVGFMSSDYSYRVQMQRAMERHERGEARVIPVILKPVDWQDAPFGKLQPLPTNGKPITRWQNRDEAFLDVTNGIKQVINEIIANTLSKLSTPRKHDELSSEEASMPNKQQITSEREAMASDVTLIDASLDPHESPYLQSIEGGRKKIQYVGQNRDQINIDQIIQKDHRFYRGFRYYHFPTIDFKFQNTGTATAFLWQFAIRILHAEIDPTPDLDFKLQIENDALEVVAVNNGWGTAQDCHISIEEPTLNRLFTNSGRTFEGTIPTGEQARFLSLIKELADPEQFDLITKEFTDLPHHYPGTIRGIKLQPLYVKWSSKGDENIKYEGEENVASSDSMGDYVLIENGFFKTSNWYAGGGAPSGLTYSTIIDPLKGFHERLYPMSRQIPPGDIERFHIMVGAPMSCHLLIQFKIFVDAAEVIESEVFEVNIWNPRNSQWDYGYKDREELKRDIDEQQNLVDTGRLDSEYKKLAQAKLEDLQRLASNYPFVERDQIRWWLF